jgi:hypothetical protein
MTLVTRPGCSSGSQAKISVLETLVSAVTNAGVADDKQGDESEQARLGGVWVELDTQDLLAIVDEAQGQNAPPDAMDEGLPAALRGAFGTKDSGSRKDDSGSFLQRHKELLTAALKKEGASDADGKLRLRYDDAQKVRRMSELGAGCCVCVIQYGHVTLSRTRHAASETTHALPSGRQH